MPSWQKMLRHDALIHRYKEAVRNALTYACPRVTGGIRSANRAPAGVEPLEPRLLLTGSIAGTVFADTNNDGIKDAGEDQMSGQLVFIDLNDDRVYQSGTEQSTTTDINGDYLLDQLAVGTYDVVIQAPAAGWSGSGPNVGVLDDVAVAADQDVTGQDLGLRAEVAIDIAVSGYQGLAYALSLDGAAGFATSWDIDWGDGTSETVAHAPSVSHAYVLSTGALTPYTITATATDGTYTFEAAPDVFYVFATADYRGSDSGAANAPVLEGHDARHKLTITNPGDLTGITVNWGDGSDPEVMNLGSLVWDPSDPTLVYLPHKYDSSGAFTARFMVSREGYETVTTEAGISVGNAVPVIDLPASGSAVVGELVELNLQATDPGINDTIQKWRVLWGDEAPGASPQEIDAVVGNPSDLTIAHQYTAAGSYDVVIQAMDSEGAWTQLQSPAGDLNGDGFVGIEDLNIVLGAWNQNVPPADPRADPSGDGFVGIQDMNIVLGNWNKSHFSFTIAVTEEPTPAPLTFVVSTPDDESDDPADALSYIPGGLSLREALALAANHPGQDIIAFDPTVFGTAQTILLGGTELLIDSHIAILGPGTDRLTIDAQDLSRVFKIEGGIAASIGGLTITGGRSGDTSQGGAGIFSEGDLVLQSSHVVGNQTGGVGDAGFTGGGFGSGIHQTTGQIRIIDSTISGNNGAVYGGGLYTLDATSVIIVNTTISGNTSQAMGGGIAVFSETTPTTVALTNVTVTDNSTGSVNSYDIPIGFGGGFALGNGATATINNTIIAGNSNPVAPDTRDVAITGDFSMIGFHNLIGFDPTIGNGIDHGVNGNIVGGEVSAPAIDPLLGALDVNGGPTPTHLPLPGSPVISAAGPSLAIDPNGDPLLYDQRGDGFDRDYGGGMDIGAVESSETRIWREAEYADSLTDPMRVIGDLTASGSRLIMVSDPANLQQYATPTTGIATYTFHAEAAGTYYLWGRVIAPHADADSFQVRSGQAGLWSDWIIPDTAYSNDWQWSKTPLVITLANQGDFVVEIAYRHDGTQLDKLLVTDNSAYTPQLEGGPDIDTAALNRIELTATVRDFHAKDWQAGPDATTKGHPDFQNGDYTASKVTAGLLQTRLGPDGKPVFRSVIGEGQPGSSTQRDQLTSAYSFGLWYNDNARYNQSLDISMTLLEDPTRPGTYQFVGSTSPGGLTATTNEFFPIDGLLFNADDQSPDHEPGYRDDTFKPGFPLEWNTDEILEYRNYHFTVELHAEFTYQPGQNLNIVKSDDDLWIFINNQLAVDLGGIHPSSGIDLPLDGLGLVAGQTYPLDLFYADRHTSKSFLIFETTIQDLHTRGSINTAPYFTSDPYQDELNRVRVVDTLADNTPAPHHLEMVADGSNELVYSLAGLDPEGDSIAFSIVQGPDGAGANDMWIDTGGGAPVLRWKPASLGGADTVTHQVRLRVTDEHGLYSAMNDQLFQIKLLPPVTNLPPEFDYVPQVDVNLSDGLNDQAHAIDPDNLPEELTYTGHLVAPPADESLNDALSGYWNFDNSLADGGVFNNPVTVTGATLQPYIGINGALEFDGLNDYAYADSAIDPAANSFTVAAWVRLDRLPASGNMVLIGQADTTYPANWLYVDSTGILKSDLGGSTAVSTDPLTPEAWHHVAMTYDLGTETLKLYVDGELVDTETSVAADPAAGQIIFGKDADNPSDYLDGALDDVRIYKFVRTAEEIDNLANPYGSEFSVTTAGLITWQPPAALSGKRVTLDMRVEDPAGLYDIYNYQLNVTGALPDLAVDVVDPFTAQFDPQALTIAGTVKAKIANLGGVAVTDPFNVLFFEDIDFDHVYSPGIDNMLGTTIHNARLKPGQSAWVAADLEGDVQYAGAIIWAWADSGETIVEIDEANNILRSHHGCNVVPIASDFDIILERRLDDGHIGDGVMATPVVADIDKDVDGMPEVVAFTTSGYIAVIDPISNTEIASIYVGGGADGANLAIGQLDDDPQLEIVAAFSYSSGYVAVYDLNTNNSLTEKWREPGPDSYWAAPSLVDFNHDGRVEIVVGTYVYRATDGELLGDGTNTVGTGFGFNYQGYVGPISTVADLDLDGTPEIIAGNSAYTFNGSSVGHYGTWTGTNISDGFTAIANFDSDPYPEIVLVSDGFVSVLDHDGQVKYGPVGLVLSDKVTPDIGKGGAPTIGNFDDDDGLEIGVAGYSAYNVFEIIDGQLSVQWSRTIQDETSHVTGSSLFDFNGDGKVEVVYADEVQLHIFDGETGDPLHSTPIYIGSATGTELPVIADVDADGHAEILVVSNYNYGAYNGIMIYGGTDDSWLPTRQIWNQHSYHVTNVNDDGSIPRYEVDSWSSAHTNAYRVNTFPDSNLNRLNAPDLIPSYLRIEDIGGGSTQYTIRVGNSGSATVAAGVNVVFYNTTTGEPVEFDVGGAGSVVQTQNALAPGQWEDVVFITSDAAVTPDYVMVIVDDDGAGVGSELECNELNNFYPMVPTAQVTSTPTRYGRAGDPYSYTVEASDVLLDQMTMDPLEKRTFQLVKRPLGTETDMTIDPDTGVITWSPGERDDGVYPVQVMVRYTDINNSSKLTRFGVQSYDLRISERANSRPIIVGTSNDNLATDGTYTITIEASDAENDTLTFSADPARGSVGFAVQPDGVTAVMTWTPGEGITGGFTLPVEVADDFGKSTIKDIYIPAINNKPIFITDGLDVAVAGQDYYFSVVAVDPENRVDLQGRGVTYAKGGGQWTNINLDTDTGLITTDPSLAVGSYTFTIEATDVDLNSKSHEYTLYVDPAPPSNTPPTIDIEPRDEVGVGQWFVYRVGASDEDGDHVTVVDAKITPAGGGEALTAVDYDPATRVLFWRPSADDLGNYDVVIEVSDGVNASVTAIYSLKVVPETSGSAPVINDKDYPSAKVGQPYRITLEATDADNDPVWWYITDKPDVLMVIDPETGEFLWTPQEAHRPSQDVYIRAIDATGMSSSIKLTIPVRSANTPPRIRSITPVPGEGFKYLVKAEDIDGEDLTITIGPDSDLVAGVDGVTFEQIDRTTAVLTWPNPIANPDPYQIQFEVTDGSGTSDIKGLDVTVSSGGGSFSPTSITPDPSYFAMPGAAYVYTFQVTDLDDPASANTIVTLPTKPTGMSDPVQDPNDPSLWTITWTPTTAQAGTGAAQYHDVVINVDDGTGATTTFSYGIGVRANHRPTIEAGRTIDVYSGQRFTYRVRAEDQDNDLILYELKQTDGSPIPDTWGLSIDEYGRITWENADANRTFVVRAADTFPASYEDPAGSWVESTFTLNVLADSAAPTITISGAQGQLNPGSVIHLQLNPSDVGSGIAQITLEVTYDSQTEPVPVGPDYIASFRIPADAEPGDVFTFTAKAWDNAGLTGTSSPYNRTVYNPGAEEPGAPTVQLVSPSIDASKGLISIQNATELVGKVYDAVNTLKHYKVDLQPVSGGNAITIKEVGESGSTNYIENVGSAVTNGVIAVIDPTLIADGTYQIVISARDVSGNSVTMYLDYIQIESQIKVGNFNVSFTDLSIPIAGQNIRVVRSYDSLMSGTEGDFGYGWTADILAGKLEVTGLGDATSDIELGLLETLNYTAAYQQGTRITLTLPNGREYGFTATPILRDDFGAGFAWLAGGLGGVLHFQPDPGQNAVLDFGPGNTRIFDDIIQNGELIHEGYRSVDILLDEHTGQFRSGGAGGLPVSPQNLGVKEFRLRDVDGSTYFFDVNTGQLLRSEDPFGNVTKYTSNGDITVEDNQSNPLATIKIDRDDKGRIIKITAPDGSAMTYAYDPETGDLEEFTNMAGETVTFEYVLDPFPDHYLSTITQDNDTIMEVVFEQDPEGSNAYRVKSISDASGADANFGYELDLSNYTLPNDGYTAETVTDGDNYTSNTVLRNERGNTARQIRNIYDSSGTIIESYLITLLGYHDPTNPDLVTHQSQPFSLTAGGSDDPFTYLPSDFTWASISQYDDKGRLTHTINGVLYSVAFDVYGDPVNSIWYGPTVTEYRDFDRFGNPQTILTPGGGQTSNTYTSNGQIGSTTQTFTDADGVKRTSTTNYGYSPQGSLNTITQVNDKGEEIVLSSFVYDALGRLIKSTDSNDRSRYFAYDLNGNQTHSWQVWQNDPDTPTAFKTLVTATEYDLQGRVTGAAQFVFNDNVVTDHHDNGDNGAAYLETNAPNDTDAWTGVTPPAALQSYSLTEYNSRGLVTKSTDQFGAVSYTFYDKRGLVVETASQTQEWNVGTQSYDPAWMVSRTVYDSLGRATHSIDPYIVTDTGNPSLYDERPASINTFGSITVYDRHGRVEETQRDNNLTIDVTASGSWYTSALGGTTPSVITRSATLYDDSGRVHATINYNDPSDDGLPTNDDARTDYYYDATGRQIGVLGPVVEVAGEDVRTLSVTLYDSAGRQKQSITGYAILNTVTNFATHPDLFPSADTLDASTIDTARSQTRTTAFGYDDLGRVDTTTLLGDPNTDADDVVTKTVFDSQGRRVAEIDPLGRRTDYRYDDTGRLVAVTLPQIDPHAQATGSYDARRPRYEYTYDIYGNQTAITDPIGTSTVTAGDRQTDFTYDHLGRQTSRTLPEDQTETMHYNDTPIVTVQGQPNPEASVGGGQLAYAVDFEGNVTAYRYDNTAAGRGRLISKTYYNATEISITITTATTLAQIDSELSSATAERSVTYTYDAFGRVLLTDDDAFTTATANTYDAQGRLTRVESPQGIINYRYDARGQLERTWTGDTTASDDAGSPTTETAYTYDSLGRLETVTQTWRNTTNINDETTTYAYDVNGNLDLQVAEWTDVVTDYGYDLFDRIEQITHFKDLNDDRILDINEDVLTSFTYEYQPNGLRTQAIETDDLGDETTITWTYDGLGRLVREVSDGDNNDRDYTDIFTYDLASNRLSLSHSDAVKTYKTTYSYDDNDRLMHAIRDYTTGGTDTNTQYTYDYTLQTGKTVREGLSLGGGNLVSKTTYHYDASGRMSKVEIDTDGDSVTDSTVTYEYNDIGLRVSETTDDGVNPEVVTEFIFDTQNPTGYAKQIEEHVDGTLTRTFMLGHTLLAQHDTTNGQLIFLMDAHGSTRAVVNTFGIITQRYAFNAFGDTLAGTDYTTADNALTPWLRPDGAYSPATGLTNHIARWRDGARFLTLDPYAGNIQDPLSLHKYLYAHGNPVMGVDPGGMFTLVEVLMSSSIRTYMEAVYDTFLNFGSAYGVANFSLNYAQYLTELSTAVVAAGGVVEPPHFLITHAQAALAQVSSGNNALSGKQVSQLAVLASLIGVILGSGTLGLLQGHAPGSFQNLNPPATGMTKNHHHINQWAAFKQFYQKAGYTQSQASTIQLSANLSQRGVGQIGTQHHGYHQYMRQHLWGPARQNRTTVTVAQYNKVAYNYYKQALGPQRARWVLHYMVVEQKLIGAGPRATFSRIGRRW